MPKLLEVCELGNPILRQVATKVDQGSISDLELQSFIDDMLHTCAHYDGMGIAAPQVGKSLRIIIIASKANSRYPNAPDMEPLVMINPNIIFQNKDWKIDWEGCLSLPGLRAHIPRPTLIEVEFLERNGTKRTASVADFLARIIQHEVDHLNGVMFFERTTFKDFISEKEYRKLVLAGQR